MECWQCNRPSQGICRFCGRAICRDHFKPMPFIFAVFKDQEGRNAAIVVEDALYCGVCKPRDEPVVLRNLK
jgi:hypothetical protein